MNSISALIALALCSGLATAAETTVHDQWLALVKADVGPVCSVSEPRIGDRLIGNNGFMLQGWTVDTCRGTYTYTVTYYPPTAFPHRSTPYEVTRESPSKQLF